MTTLSRPESEQAHPRNRRPVPAEIDDTIDLRELMERVGRGAYQILGLGLIGGVLAVLIALVAAQIQPVTTSTRVTFAFPGFERGQYPDESEFQADDLRAPAIIADALRRQGLDASSEAQSRIRGALAITGIIPANITKAADRLRASGQTPPPYVPDEYRVSLSLPRTFPLSRGQRERLLSEIVSVYRENFGRTYGAAPLAFGTAFETLRDADFPEYELVLNAELDEIRRYLQEKADNPQALGSNDPLIRQRAERAQSFRSPTTNLSFKDLLEQAELFSQLQVNEVLGLIHQNGLSRNRETAMLKMNYYLRLLQDRERRAIEEENVVRGLLEEAQAKSQNYVLGATSRSSDSRSGATIMDQGLIDSLLANDSYNFLVRRALDAGLSVKQVQAQKARLIALRDNMQSFMEGSFTDQSAIVDRARESLQNLAIAYHRLIASIRQTHTDFARQEFANAVRSSEQVKTAGILKPLAVAGTIGGFLGLAIGGGLALLGIYVGRNPALAHQGR